MRDRGSRRIQNLLAVSQMALVVVLLVACGLMVRSFRVLSGVDPGFRSPEKLLALRLYIPREQARTGAEVATTYEAIARRLADLPGVDSVGLATATPMDGARNFNPFYVEGEVGPDAGRLSRRHKWIGGDYLETLGVPLLAGRSITWDDVHDRAPVALLSESLAREVFGSAEAALGRRIAARPDPPRWKEVVGVVADVREDGMGQDPPALVYWPYDTLGFWQGNPADQVQIWRSAGIALRSDRVGTAAFQKAVQEAIWEVSPNLPLIAARPLDDLMADSMARTSFSMVLLGVAAAVGLILGFVGVYGVISYAVTQRSAEIGMRMALGAGAGQVQAMVLRQGSVLAAWGVGIGLGIAAGVTRLMSGLLFGVSPADPATYVGVAAGLVSVALLASYLPARRAASVDPVVALRAE